MHKSIFLFLITLLFLSCETHVKVNDPVSADNDPYSDSTLQTGGIRMIPITTPVGNFRVWTKKFGNNPNLKVLLLHGGPAMGHEYLECFESFFPRENIEFYEYDQLGSSYSDMPADSSLWTTDRFVDEVEQVRKVLGLDQSNFILYGHSWGGILAMEYALKHGDQLKGLIISNMMASAPDYGKYSEVLAAGMDQSVVAEIRKLEMENKTNDPRYEELLMPHFYSQHILRLSTWPEPVERCFRHLNKEIYTMMQGPSEFGISGRLANWDRKADLPKLTMPTLIIGSRYDTMDPEHMKWMSTQVKKGSYLFCPNGSHLSMYDDQKRYMSGVVDWVKQLAD